MKLVIAPDKFKGSLTGFEFCNAVSEGLRKANSQFEILEMPLADGGDGTAAVVQHYIKGKKISIIASDPLFRSIKTSYIFNKEERIAYIEMAEISGLQLLTTEERNCMNTTSLGTGELLVDAIERGAKNIILGIGGSATNDGGMGMAQAFGFRFLDGDDKELKPIGCNLIALKRIDSSQVYPGLSKVNIKIACDVSNPFHGKDGAAHIYAAQKGASKKEIKTLDGGLRNYAKVLLDEFNIDVQNVSGSGAAGGMGGGALVLFGGQLISGIELIKELAHFDDAISNADWVITGEGNLDRQTLSGKTIAGVLQSAKRNNIPVAALCGSVSISEKEVRSLGLDYVKAVSNDCSNLDDAILNAYPNLVKAAEELGRSIL